MRYTNVLTAATYFATYLFRGASAQTWCGKNYMQNQPVVPPGNKFSLPELSSSPHLALRCTPAFRPYLDSDVDTDGRGVVMVVDTVVGYRKIKGAQDIDLGDVEERGTVNGSDTGGSLDLTIMLSLDDSSSETASSSSGQPLPTPPSSNSSQETNSRLILARTTVPLNVTGFQIPLNLSGVVPKKGAYEITCEAAYAPSSSGSSPSPYATSKPLPTATSVNPKASPHSSGSNTTLPSLPNINNSSNTSSQIFRSITSLFYLPDPVSGSVTKMDALTGALWVRPANYSGSGGTTGVAPSGFRPFFPYGFYADFDYLANNLSVIDVLVADGFNTIHPISPYINATTFTTVAEYMQQRDMYIVCDLNSTYTNITALSSLVPTLSTLPNLLQYETAHQPDGPVPPSSLNASAAAVQAAYKATHELDGYHPISIVLTCEDYGWEEFAKGADVVLQDAYPMGIDPTYSSVWNTSCTPDFGNCGCDNCVGSLVDVRQRVGSFKERMQIMGWERDKAVWSVPQAFESEGLQYWNATPTGQQWLAFTFLSLTHGARGSVSFSYPTTTGNVTTIEGTAPGFSGVFDSVVLPYVFGEGISSGVNEAVDGKFDSYFINGVDVGIWWNGTIASNSTVSSSETLPTLLARDSPVGSNATIGPNTALIILTNTLLDPSFVAFDVIGLGGLTNATEQVERVFSVNSRTNVSGLVPEGEGVGIYLVQL